MAATYILGPFRLDAETDTLFRGGEPVSLGDRAVALLRVLVEQRDIPVSLDALMDVAVSLSRRATSQCRSQPYVEYLGKSLAARIGDRETLPRRGYRFIGPASIRDQGAVIAASQNGGSNPDSGTERGCRLLALLSRKLVRWYVQTWRKLTLRLSFMLQL